MKYKFLGKNKLKVSSLGLGCMSMSEFYGTAADNEESKLNIKRAYELGINHFDTADIYGHGHNELLLGEAIKDFNRNKIVIATKCGLVRGEPDGAIIGVDSSPQYIKKSCEASLRRLGVDYIDLFYLHRVNPQVPLEMCIGALAELVNNGKVLHIGLSGVDANIISQANEIYPITAIQSEYSIWTRDEEKTVIPLCKSLDIGFVAYSPIGRGFLSGKINSPDQLEINDFRRILPRFQAENIQHNLSIVKILTEIAENKGCTTAQIALAWIIAQDHHLTAIPGTRNIKHLEENIKAVDIELSQEEITKLNTQIPFGFAKGDLLPKNLSSLTD